jgi:hypothetical protein
VPESAVNSQVPTIAPVDESPVAVSSQEKLINRIGNMIKYFKIDFILIPFFI